MDTRDCAFCGFVFPQDGKRIYCSIDCAKEADRDKKRKKSIRQAEIDKNRENMGKLRELLGF